MMARADSLSYLNISDSTVISFIVPTLTAFICFVALKVTHGFLLAAAMFVS
jgi:hypothetical protein